MLLGAGGLLLAGSAAGSELLVPTPRQTAGPFYPVELPLDDDNDLTRVRGSRTVAKGRISNLSGRVVDVNGRALRGVRIEIWQCDANGRYRHPRDRAAREMDENFQGFGHTVTDPKGRYRFRTIRPVPYPGRTPHIHMAAYADGRTTLVTQLYVKDEPRNARDFLFNSIPAERRYLVLAGFEPAFGGRAELSAQFDIVLGGADGTPSV